MAPKRKAATATKAKAEISPPKKAKAAKNDQPAASAAVAAAAGSSDGKALSLIIEAW